MGVVSGLIILCILLFQCPILYTPYNGHCYYVSPVPLKWGNAQTDCRQETNGDLAIIEDQAENDFIRDMIQADIGTNMNTVETVSIALAIKTTFL